MINRNSIASALIMLGLYLGLCNVASAEIFPKDITAIKDGFDNAGATSCSYAIANTMNFLAKGGNFSNNRQWSTTDTNKKPITIDFLIEGNKDNYSKSGSIILTPSNGKCLGGYVVSYVAPSDNCKTYIQKNGFDGKEWSEDNKSVNGDGGTAYYLSVKKNNSLEFILNDVAGGCSVTKRETLFEDAK